MGTQGLLTILNHDTGVVKVKVVIGCSGDVDIPRLAHLLQVNRVTDPDAIYRMALSKKIGCVSCLVVMSEDQITCSDLPTRWQDTFNIPDFNPRWERGLTDCFEYLFEEDIVDGSRVRRNATRMVCRYNRPVEY